MAAPAIPAEPSRSRKRVSSEISSHPCDGNKCKENRYLGGKRVGVRGRPLNVRPDAADGASGVKREAMPLPRDAEREVPVHGGPSPGAPKGNKNALKHGRYTEDAISQR